MSSLSESGALPSPVAAGPSIEEVALERARKRYDLEDPSAEPWKLHRKHIFVLSSAGKPIFSRYGDESKLAPLAGVLQALISFVRDSNGDTIRYIRAGLHRVVFVMRGPLYLVAVSSSGETVAHLSRQLSFLHSQIISILTSKVESVFQRNASYDLRGLLGGTDRVIRQAIRCGSSEPSLLLRAIPCLRVPPAARAELNKQLAKVWPTELIFGLLLAHNHLVSYMKPKRTQLHVDDVLLVMNTVASSASFREDESWLPICLPRFNSTGFLYAHISFVAPELCLVLLTPKPDGFPQLSASRAQLVQRLEQQAELRASLIRAVASPQYAVHELDVPEVRHCLYRLHGSSTGLDLMTAPRTGALAGPQCPYHDRPAAKRLLRAYQLAHARVHATGKPLREYVLTTATETLVVWSSPDAELYVVFGPLMPKPYAIAACHKLLRRLKKEQASLFVLHGVTK